MTTTATEQRRGWLSTIAVCAGLLALGFCVAWLKYGETPSGVVALVFGIVAVVLAGLEFPLTAPKSPGRPIDVRPDVPPRARRVMDRVNPWLLLALASVATIVALAVTNPELLLILVLVGSQLWQAWVALGAVVVVVVVIVAVSSRSR